MFNQLVKGVSNGLGGCDFYFYSIRGDCRFVNQLIQKGVNAGVNEVINQVKKRL